MREVQAATQLALQFIDALGIASDHIRQKLQRDVHVDALVVSEPDHSHSTATEFLFQEISAEYFRSGSAIGQCDVTDGWLIVGYGLCVVLHGCVRGELASAHRAQQGS